LFEFHPEIVHFVGHGSGEDGILLEDTSGNPFLVSGEVLSELFGVFSEIECVLLNACYTEAQAKAISQHIGYVIGMHSAVDDNAAIEFAVAFYETLGAGESYIMAYKIGRNAMRMHGVPENLLPTIIESPNSVEKRKKRELAQREQLLRERLRHEEEFASAVGDIVHDYAEKVVNEILSRQAQAQFTSGKLETPNLAGRWQGMVDGREQIVEIRQQGTVVYLEGFAQGDPRSPEYTFTGQGRIICNVLVFSWRVDNTNGINVMSVLGSNDVLDGKYFTATIGGASEGSEIYHLVK
jgi:hypothetical protein